MKHIVFTADDFGVVPSIDEGIRIAIRKGLVKSVAAFSNYKDSVKNVKNLLEEFPDVEMGVHLTISSGKPLNGADSNLLCDGENFRSYNDFKLDNDTKDAFLKQLEAELKAQIEVFVNNDIPVYHLSSHHNLLTFLPELYTIFLNLARSYNLKVRSPKVIPRFKQNLYLLVVRIQLFQNLGKTYLKKIKKFGKRIKVFYKKNSDGVKTLGFLDTSHYGPIPVIKIIDPMGNILATQKYNKLIRRLWFFKFSMHRTSEFVLHLRKDDLEENSDYENEIKETKYTGIDPDYFDSRIVELRSITKLTVDKLKNIGINPGSWKE